MATLSRPRSLYTVLLIATIAGPLCAQGESRPASAPALPKNPEKALAALNRASEKSKKKRDMSAEMDMNFKIMNMEIKGSGKMEMAADGRMRQEMTMTVPMAPGPMKNIVINDGKTIWSINEGGMGQSMIVKGSKEEFDDVNKKQGGGGMMGGSGMGDPAEQVSELKKQADFDTIEEDITIDGKSFWAVSGDKRKDAFKGGQAAMMMASVKRIRVLFTKETDIFSGMEMVDGGGNKTMSMMLKNINLEPKFADDLFKFAPPEGATVQNLADLMRGMGGIDEGEEDEEEDAPPASKPAGGK